MYKCPNCGGEIEFAPEDGKIKCSFCGSEFDPKKQFKSKRKNAEEHVMAEEGIVYTCSQCGANIYTTEETGVTFCSYCGSQAFLKSRVHGKEDVEPDLIIPFSISKEQCLTIYSEKVKKAWYLPRSMKADQAVEKFRGIYMPCWIYEVVSDAKVSDLRGQEQTSKGNKIHVKEYSYDAEVHGHWDGYVYDATSSFPDRIMGEITPYDLKRAVPFDAKYMAGFYADIGNVPSEAYSSPVLKHAETDLYLQISRNNDLRGSGVGYVQINDKTKHDTRIKKAKKGFMPVWFLSNKNPITGKMSYAIVNGQNGKIHTDLPVDMKKFLLLALAIMIPAFLLLQFITLKPEILMVIIMIILGFTMSISTKMITDVFIHQHSLDDVGASYGENDVYRSRYLQQVKDGKHLALKKKRKGPGTVAMAVICFFGFPVFMSFLSVMLGTVNMTSVGFALGIVFFIVSKCTFAKKNRNSVDQYETKNNIKLPFGVTVRAMIWQLIGILAGLLILMLAPVRDIYYYAGVVICAIMLILTILGFVRKNNALSLRKPAQLNKRGGDEDEE